MENLKTPPYPAAYAFLADIWEFPPPPPRVITPTGSDELESLEPLNLVKLHGHFILPSFHVLYIIQHFRHILVFHFLFFWCSLSKEKQPTPNKNYNHS